MNCINHPETPVSAFCQHCGKPLCAQCVRPVQGMVYCEPCLAARLSGAPEFSNTGYGPAGFGASGPLPNGSFSDRGPQPWLAGILGFIPGVGAMYNGQFIKALVHVLVFVVLISVAEHHDAFGIFVATWIFYQVFDGYQTAKARRDGLPLPDPFGLNELGNRMSGSHTGNPQPGNFNSWPSPPAAGAASGFTDQGIGMGPGTNTNPGAGPVAGQGASQGSGFPPAAGFTSQPGNPPYAEYPYSQVPPDPSVGMPPPYIPRRSEPVRAIILIGLGVLFLCSTTGFINGEWISHGWPLVLIGVGAWMLIRRLSEAKK